MAWLGSGVAHTVYALNARDAAGFGVQHAILRVNTNEFCEGSDPYRGRLLDRLVVEARVNVQMGQMGVGPAVLHSCLLRRIAPGDSQSRSLSSSNGGPSLCRLSSSMINQTYGYRTKLRNCSWMLFSMRPPQRSSCWSTTSFKTTSQSPQWRGKEPPGGLS